MPEGVGVIAVDEVPLRKRQPHRGDVGILGNHGLHLLVGDIVEIHRIAGDDIRGDTFHALSLVPGGRQKPEPNTDHGNHHESDAKQTGTAQGSAGLVVTLLLLAPGLLGELIEQGAALRFILFAEPGS